jgi:hypothetical protein
MKRTYSRAFPLLILLAQKVQTGSDRLRHAGLQTGRTI